MKFDLIIGNPPYDKSLHLKILKKAMEYCDFDNGGEIVWLSPIDKWQKAKLFGNEPPVSNTFVASRIPMDEAYTIFGIEQRTELGIISTKPQKLEIINNYDLMHRLRIKLFNLVSEYGSLKDKLSIKSGNFPVHFTYGCTIAGNGGHGIACYRIVGQDERKSCRGGEIGHTRFYNAKNKAEQHAIWKAYSNLMIRFIAKEFGFGGVPYDIIPWIEAFKDKNNKTPLDKDWTFLDFCEFLNFTSTDINILKTSLTNYFNENEKLELKI